MYKTIVEFPKHTPGKDLSNLAISKGTDIKVLADVTSNNMAERHTMPIQNVTTTVSDIYDNIRNPGSVINRKIASRPSVIKTANASNKVNYTRTNINRTTAKPIVNNVTGFDYLLDINNTSQTAPVSGFDHLFN